MKRLHALLVMVLVCLPALAIGDDAADLRILRAENVVLRKQVAALQAENAKLKMKLAEALPVPQPATQPATAPAKVETRPPYTGPIGDMALLSEKMKVGSAGYVLYVTVQHIFADGSALVALDQTGLTGQEYTYANRATGRVSLGPRREPIRAVLAGLDTSTWVSDGKAKVCRNMKVVGTVKPYPDGNTFLKLEPYPKAP